MSPRIRAIARSLPNLTVLLSAVFPPAVLLPAVLLLAVSLRAQERSEFLPHDGVLVLRNGFVLQGRITPIQDAVLISTSTNGEVRLPRAEIEFECRSMEEAYERQLEQMTSDTPTARLRLAEWCLRHGLLHRAADQLLAVQVLNPVHPRLEIVEQRLMSLAHRARIGPEAAREPEPNSPTAIVAARVTPKSMQRFTTVVQPILLNRCAIHSCHGSGGSSGLRLIRPSAGHTVTSRVTQRNLQSLLAFVNYDDPEESDLLVVGSRPHGGSEKSPFTDKQINQYELLAEWVRHAAAEPSPAIAKNRGGPGRIKREVASRIPDSAAGHPGQGVEFAGGASAAGNAAANPRQAGHQAQPAIVPGQQQATPPRTPAAPATADSDPFDAEVYNRNFLPAGR